MGVYNKGNASVSYTFTAALHACPNGCSGRGTCDHATGICTCTEVGGVTGRAERSKAPDAPLAWSVKVIRA